MGQNLSNSNNKLQKRSFRRRSTTFSNSVSQGVCPVQENPTKKSKSAPNSPVHHNPVTIFSTQTSKEETNSPEQLPASNNNLSINVFVTKYAYKALSPNQITCERGEYLHVLGYSEDHNWCEAVTRNSQSGWVPSNYIKPVKLATRDGSLIWYHGQLSKAAAETRLTSQGINGSFLVRDSEGEPGMMTVSVLYDAKVYHYRVSFDPLSGQYYINPKKRFGVISELIQYHSHTSEGLVHALWFPISKIDTDQLLCSNHSYQMIISAWVKLRDVNMTVSCDFGCPIKASNDSNNNILRRFKRFSKVRFSEKTEEL